MNNHKSNYVSVLLFLIGAIIYSLCVFLIAKEHGTAFWTIYAFTMVAFVAQIAINLCCRMDTDIKRDGYLKLPVFIVGGIYLAVQLVVGIILMAISVSSKLALVFDILVFGIFAIILLGSISGAKSISDTGNVYADQKDFIKKLRQKIEIIYNEEIEPERKKELKKLYEAVKYAEPMSKSMEVLNINEQIQAAVDLVFEGVRDKSTEDLENKVQRATDLIFRRDAICKANK